MELSVPKTVKSLLSFLHNIKFNTDFEIEAVFTGENEALINSDNTQIFLNTYCLDFEKETPIPNTEYIVSNKLLDVNLDLESDEEFFYSSQDDIQNKIWKKRFLDNPSEIYVSEVAFSKIKKINLKYGTITFLRDYEIFIFKNKESFITFNTEILGNYTTDISTYDHAYQLENGNIIISLLEKDIIEKLKELKVLGFNYIEKVLNHK